jgi:hypothetical protein
MATQGDGTDARCLLEHSASDPPRSLTRQAARLCGSLGRLLCGMHALNSRARPTPSPHPHRRRMQALAEHQSKVLARLVQLRQLEALLQHLSATGSSASQLPDLARPLAAATLQPGGAADDVMRKLRCLELRALHVLHAAPSIQARLIFSGRCWVGGIARRLSRPLSCWPLVGSTWCRSIPTPQAQQSPLAHARKHAGPAERAAAGGPPGGGPASQAQGRTGARQAARVRCGGRRGCGRGAAAAM